MGNACLMSSSGLGKLYFSGVGLMSPAMNSKDAASLDPVHPSVVRQKQYQDLAFEVFTVNPPSEKAEDLDQCYFECMAMSVPCRSGVRPPSRTEARAAGPSPTARLGTTRARRRAAPSSAAARSSAPPAATTRSRLCTGRAMRHGCTTRTATGIKYKV